MLGVALFAMFAAASPSLMSREEHSAERNVLQAARDDGLADCGTMPRRAAHVCTAEVVGEDDYQRAELESRYRGTVSAASDALAARSQANDDIANAKCANLSGGEFQACLQAARLSRIAGHPSTRKNNEEHP